MQNGSLYLEGRSVTLEQLRTFVVVAEYGGFIRASEELGRTQSTLSLSLKKLEAVIGCKLMHRRQGQMLGLSREGRRLLPAACDVLTRVNEALRSLQGPEMAGKIVLGIPDDFGIVDVNAAISRCLTANPSLRIEVIAGSSPQLAALLDQNLLDIAILKRLHTRPAANGKERVLRIEPLHWVCGRPVAFEDFSEIPLVTFQDGCVIREAALQALHAASRPYYPSYTSGSFDNVRGAITAGLGIGVLPKNALSETHHILSPRSGAPRLPNVQLSLIVASKGTVYDRFADYLIHTP